MTLWFMIGVAAFVLLAINHHDGNQTTNILLSLQNERGTVLRLFIPLPPPFIGKL
jgi:hypothetical protein